MTQEDKELLLKDLCARLPYDLIVRVLDINDPTYQKDGNLYNIKYLEGDYNGIPYLFDVDNQVCLCDITEIKPYLRSMSSMTEEERKEYNDIVKNTIEFYDCPKSKEICFFIIPIEWLNKKMFDYRGLIPKGLAVEAPEGMYGSVE
jgi:hypothetical protein